MLRNDNSIAKIGTLRASAIIKDQLCGACIATDIATTPAVPVVNNITKLNKKKSKTFRITYIFYLARSSLGWGTKPNTSKRQIVGLHCIQPNLRPYPCVRLVTWRTSIPSIMKIMYSAMFLQFSLQRSNEFIICITPSALPIMRGSCMIMVNWCLTPSCNSLWHSRPFCNSE